MISYEVPTLQNSYVSCEIRSNYHNQSSKAIQMHSCLLWFCIAGFVYCLLKLHIFFVRYSITKEKHCCFPGCHVAIMTCLNVSSYLGAPCCLIFLLKKCKVAMMKTVLWSDATLSEIQVQLSIGQYLFKRY